MERPGAALIGSVLVHGGVIAAVLAIGLFAPRAAPRPVANAVPVSIVSSTVIEAAAADNPSEELVTEDATTAPVAPPPEPVPTPPQPKPVPPPVNTPTPVKKAPPPRPTPPRPTPPRAQPTPPRPAPPRREETLDLDALAGPARPATRPGTRPATGQQGRETAPRATGPAQWSAIFNQVYRNWSPPCDTPGVEDMRIQMDVTITPDGRIARAPTLIGRRSDPVWIAVAAGAERALYQSAPFDVPNGFEGGTARTTFLTSRICGG